MTGTSPILEGLVGSWGLVERREGIGCRVGLGATADYATRPMHGLPPPEAARDRLLFGFAFLSDVRSYFF
jgi:hypothetical protein